MKRTRHVIRMLTFVLLLSAMQALLAAAVSLKEYRGILYNERCLKTQPEWLPYASEHGYQCAMMQACFLSGYYLVIDENTVYKLDKRGELLARRILLKTRKQDDFKVVIQARLKGSDLMVQSIEEVH